MVFIAPHNWTTLGQTNTLCGISFFYLIFLLGIICFYLANPLILPRYTSNFLLQHFLCVDAIEAPVPPITAHIIIFLQGVEDHTDMSGAPS